MIWAHKNVQMKYLQTLINAFDKLQRAHPLMEKQAKTQYFPKNEFEMTTYQSA